MAGSEPKMVQGPAHASIRGAAHHRKVYLSVQSYLIEHEGSYVGHALTLGTRFMFHSPREELCDLDETCFDSIETLRAAVAMALNDK